MENAFGIMAARYRIFRTIIKLEPENARGVVKGACVLHNFLCEESGARSTYCPVGFADHEDAFGNVIDGTWRNEVSGVTSTFDLRASHSRNSSHSAQWVRNQYAQYFTKEGKVPWQWDMLNIPEPNH